MIIGHVYFTAQHGTALIFTYTSSAAFRILSIFKSFTAALIKSMVDVGVGVGISTTVCASMDIM